jgi:hypothetical protein
MSEVNETATAAAEPKQATNISPSEFINRRLNQINSSIAQEEPEATEVEETEETAEQEAQEEVLEENLQTESEEVEQEEGESEQEEAAVGEEDVLSQIELDDMSDEELRELSEKLGSRAVARFGELTAKRKAAEAELEKLRSEVQNKLQPEVKESDNPYSHVTSIEDLQAVSNEVEQVVEWAEDLIFNSDGYSADDPITEVDGKELTKAEVRKHLQNARKAEKKFIPAQLKTIERKENAAARKVEMQEKAEKEFTWMKDDNEVKSKYSEMLEDPKYKDLSSEVSADLPYILAHAANSMYARKEVPASKATRTARLNPPSGTPSTAKSDKKISKSLKTLTAASDQFRGSGRKSDFIKMRTLQFSQ